MTKEQVKEAVAVMSAWTEGKQIQTQPKGTTLKSWMDYNYPTSPPWDRSRWNYRIKPVARHFWAIINGYRGENEMFDSLSEAEIEAKDGEEIIEVMEILK